MKLRIRQYNLFESQEAFLTPRGYRFVRSKDMILEYWIFPLHYVIQLVYKIKSLRI